MNPSRGFLTIPGAILIAGALIAIALIWVYRPLSHASPQASSQTTMDSPGIPDVTASDHILGNPNAPIKLVEYSDLSCPYCQEFNPTLVRTLNEFGPTGKVAWVYRSLPLLMKPVDSQGTIPHPNSGMQAQALECVADLGGNTAFFSFEKQWFSSFPRDGATRSADVDRAALVSIADTVGVDTARFDACLKSGKYGTKIDKAYRDGLAAGVTGTPTTFIFTPSGSKIPLIGAQNYSTLKNTIDTLITTIASTTVQN